MKQKVMDAMQSFSKALMGPVLFLPIAGMLQAISSVMSNTALVTDRKSTRLNSSHSDRSRMPSSA